MVYKSVGETFAATNRSSKTPKNPHWSQPIVASTFLKAWRKKVRNNPTLKEIIFTTHQLALIDHNPRVPPEDWIENRMLSITCIIKANELPAENPNPKGGKKDWVVFVGVLQGRKGRTTSSQSHMPLMIREEEEGRYLN